MRALLATLIVALALPGVAFAHATLRTASPGFGVELHRAPGTVRLRSTST